MNSLNELIACTFQRWWCFVALRWCLALIDGVERSLIVNSSRKLGLELCESVALIKNNEMEVVMRGIPSQCRGENCITSQVSK